MSSVYAMQRANGDWFALEDRGRFRVPVFRSSREAMQARASHSGMLLFRPVALDKRVLKDLTPADGERAAYFWLVDGSATNLNHGCLIEHA